MFTLLKKKDLNAFYVDTNFLYGEVKILAKEGLAGLQYNKKLELLRNFKIIILVSDLNEYEIRRRLMQDLRKTFSEAQVPLVTNERQAQEWKNIYERVYSLEEFWNEIKNG